MGITTYVFHKDDSLEEQKYNMFFLDMGENIHFHYRDLRIELSVAEFTELTDLFVQYSQGVLAEIAHGYQDGVWANTNEAKTLKTFWNKKKNLSHPVKYHEKQLAIEETRDGYHLHIRNYKILLQRDSFLNLVQAMAPIVPLLQSDKLVRAPLQLLQQNELEARLISRLQTEDSDEMVIAVPQTFYKKAEQVLLAIGYEADQGKNGSRLFRRTDSTVTLIEPSSAPSIIRPDDAGHPPLLQLTDFVKTHGRQLDHNQLNILKLKLIALLKSAEKGAIAPFRLDHIFIHQDTLNPVVDLFSEETDIHMDDEISRLSKLLAKYSLFFIKPDKTYLAPPQQVAVQDMFFQFVMTKLARHQGVKKIYTLGSSTHGRLGNYAVPFVHFDWVKINSDFDIYIELDPDCDEPLPQEWQKKFYWEKAGSDYYHFGELGDGGSSQPAHHYPHVRFYDHLIEGYLFNPLKGNTNKRDQWFKEIKAQCIFSRDLLGQWIEQHYAVGPCETERFSVASFNRVYHVKASPQDYVLKIYDSKYLTPKNKRKIAYEIGLLRFLEDSGLKIALPIQNLAGSHITSKGKAKAALFTYMPGKYIASPTTKQVRLAGSLLAGFHNSAKRYKTKHARNYSNKESLHYWLKAWQEYHLQRVTGTDINLPLAGCKKTLDELKAYPTHCHGDLSLINYLFEEDTCGLIDFQSIAYGPAIIDLSNGMIEFAARKNDFLMTNLTSFRQGYEEIRPLSSAENKSLNDLLLIQAAVRQAKLIRLHYGGFGYDLKTERLLGLKIGLTTLLQ
jgi:Ser/Thr protein kinase RdoA (MazF antagonist)